MGLEIKLGYNQLTFGELEIGDYFIIRGVNEPNVKLANNDDAEFTLIGGSPINAFNLEKSILGSIDRSTEVRKIVEPTFTGKLV